MNRRAAVQAVAVLVAASLPGVATGAVPSARHAASVVSLLAPAHGAAFAYVTGRQLLSTTKAVGGAHSVEVVTTTGAHETLSVQATNDPRLVLMTGRIDLPPLTVAASVRGTLAAQAGPLHGGRREHGSLLHGSVATTLRASASYEGAPLLDRQGRVAGVATAAGRRLDSIPAAAIRARKGSSGPNVILIVVLAIALSVVAAVAGRAAFRLGVGGLRRGQRQQAAAPVREEEPPVDVAIRHRPRHLPAEDVQLRHRVRRAERGPDDGE